jgi:prepilin-type processing-associated H-X9-DG protein
MADRGNRKRLTRVDILVVAILCLVLILLVSVLFAKLRARATRVLCGANLAQIGKAMFIYANDYEGALPRAGGPTSVWGPVPNFTAMNRYQAYGLAVDGSGGSASISSCFYLLVKYCEMPPRLFICRGDKGTTEFKLSGLLAAGTSAVTNATELVDLWDFGPLISASDNPSKHCSYAYHMPYGLYPLTTSRDPNLAVAADRNPWIRSPAADPMPFNTFVPDLQGYPGNAERARAGNAIAHEHDGQNVLFLDGRVTFEKRAYCGVGKDNIYTVSARGPDRGDPSGTMPTASSQPTSPEDSLLMHDDPSFAGTTRPNTP